MRHTTKIGIRFSDTDMLGHVNNARYFTFMEEARIVFLQDVLEGSPDSGSIPLILASANVNFRAQTFFPQTLRIESWVSRWGNSSFDISCQMYNEETNALAYDAVAVVVYFDYKKQQPTRIPEKFREQLANYTHEVVATPD